MVIIQPSVWISIWFIFIGGVIFSDRQSSTAAISTSLNVNTRRKANSTTACFISNKLNCNLFGLICENNTRIRITGTEYRYKNYTDTMENTDNNCCRLNENDCKENYTYGHAVVLYDKCSGKMTCLKNQAPQPIESKCDPKHNTTNLYIHVLHECIYDHTIIDMCNSTHKGKSEVNIQFMESLVTTNHSRTCMCNVTSNETIVYQLVDVRLFTNVNTNGDYNCSASTFSIGNSTIRCQQPNDNSFAYTNSRFFTGEIHASGATKVLELSYMEGEKPDMVWVNIKAQNNFDVCCTSELTTTTTVQKDTEGTSTTGRQTVTSAYTSSTILRSTAYLSTSKILSSDKQSNGEENPERLIIVLVVVGAVLVLSAILVIVFILHRRRCKKSPQEDAPKNQLPHELINHRSMNCGGSDQDCKAVDSSNYDKINDEIIESYSRPVKKKNDGTTIAKDEKKTVGQCATDDYDRLEFEKKYAVKMANYDRVSAIEVKKIDDTYSYVSSQSTPASAISTNDYSHCQLIRHEPRNNDNTNKTAGSNEPLVADNYSHVDLNFEKTKRRPSSSIEEDTYNHIDLDTTTTPPRNGHAVSVRNIAKSEESSRIFKDIQSLDVESEGWPICNMNSGVSSEDHPLQDIKAVSLPDNHIEFEVGDIYDTPRCNVQHYNVVLKGNKQKSGTKENNDVTEDCC